MFSRCETFRDCRTTIPLSYLKISTLCTIHCGFYGPRNTQNRMCELCMHVFPNAVTYIGLFVAAATVFPACYRGTTCGKVDHHPWQPYLVRGDHLRQHNLPQMVRGDQLWRGTNCGVTGPMTNWVSSGRNKDQIWSVVLTFVSY